MPELLVEQGPITRVTMNRPEVMNAFSTDFGDQILDALTEAGRDPDCKVVILSGAGRSFSSGDDIKEGTRLGVTIEGGLYHNMHLESFGVERHPYFQLPARIRRIPKPVIAQVQGYCLAAAMDVMLACDFAIVDPQARLGMLFGDRGIMGGTVFLPRYVGMKVANRLMFTKEFLDPAEAERLGLITKVAAPGALEEEVEAMAQYLLERGERFYAYFGLVKDTVNRNLWPTLEEDVRQQVTMTRLRDFFRQTHPPDDAG